MNLIFNLSLNAITEFTDPYCDRNKADYKRLDFESRFDKRMLQEFVDMYLKLDEKDFNNLSLSIHIYFIEKLEFYPILLTVDSIKTMRDRLSKNLDTLLISKFESLLKRVQANP